SVLPVAGPNGLRIFGESDYGDDEEDGLRAVELIEFDMNLHPRYGYINVYRSIHDYAQPTKALKRTFYRFKEWRHNLGTPSEEDLSLLHEEMTRGASGAYALKDAY